MEDVKTPFDGTQEPKQDFTIDDVIMGKEGADEGFFPETNEEKTPEPAQGNNDDVRFAYWQSEADKRQNKINEQSSQIAELSAKLGNYQGQKEQWEQSQKSSVEESDEKFPAPPQEPQPPAGYSQEEALSDPASASAKYVQRYQQYQQDRMTYADLKTEYTLKKFEDFKTSQIKKEESRRQAQLQQQQAGRQLSQVKDMVMKEYGCSDAVANDFVRKMSGQKSFTLGNLWRLYQMQGQDGQQMAQQGTPSQDFQQLRRTQQLPPNMGVFIPPTTNKQNSKSVEDRVMDEMISGFEKTNPFN